jgi:competence protein ComEC
MIVFCFYAQAVWAGSGVLTVKFLAIGQGDATLIETPRGKRILVDGGPGSTVLERLGEEDYWLSSIDLVVLTHPHADHMDGLIDVFKRFEVGAVMMTGSYYESARYDEFLRLIEEKDIVTVYPIADFDYEIEQGVVLDILFPFESIAGLEWENINNASLVAKLVYGETKMLLTGDAEEETEHEELLSRADFSADLLKAGHHGSRTSTTLPYLRAVNPEFAVMMNGVDNQFGHPHEETLAKFENAGVEFWNTKDSGTVEFVSDGRKWTRKAVW